MGEAKPMRSSPLLPKKRFGQHFLVSPTVLSGILRLAELTPEDTVVEIGAGTGVLTEALAASGRRVVALELDRDLLAPLRQRLAHTPQVEIIQADALSFDFGSVADKMVVVANLPYGTAVPILMRLLELRERLRLVVVMLQREVAERLCASPGTKAYGSLTLIVQWYAVVAKGFLVPPSAFSPRPKVMSAVVKLTPLAAPPESVCDETFLFQVIRAAFGQRRKTLVNALAAAFHPWLTPQLARTTLRSLAIDPTRRGETLTLREFSRLADALYIFSPPSPPSPSRGEGSSRGRGCGRG